MLHPSDNTNYTFVEAQCIHLQIQAVQEKHRAASL